MVLKVNNMLYVRDKNATNAAKFRHCLSNVNWQNLEGFYDPLKAYESFYLNTVKHIIIVFH